MKVADVLRARVKQVLAGQGKTPADLAKTLGSESSWASNFFTRRNAVPLTKVDLIADVLGIDAWTLFDPSVLPVTDPLYRPRSVPATQTLEDRQEGSPVAHDDGLVTTAHGVAQLVAKDGTTKQRARLQRVLAELLLELTPNAADQPAKEGGAGSPLR